MDMNGNVLLLTCQSHQLPLFRFRRSPILIFVMSALFVIVSLGRPPTTLLNGMAVIVSGAPAHGIVIIGIPLIGVRTTGNLPLGIAMNGHGVMNGGVASGLKMIGDRASALRVLCRRATLGLIALQSGLHNRSQRRQHACFRISPVNRHLPFL